MTAGLEGAEWKQEACEKKIKLCDFSSFGVEQNFLRFHQNFSLIFILAVQVAPNKPQVLQLLGFYVFLNNFK